MEIINKLKKYFSFIIVAIFFLLLASFLFFSTENHRSKNNLQIENIKYVEIGEQKVKIDLALSTKEHAKGLSGRKILENNTGMLFVFEKPAKYSFWMKEMNFPIDIIWINENFEVIYIKKNAEPSSYPDTFSPDGEAKYVLEVPALFVEKNNLVIGNSAQFLSF